jgi:hypothetical protein
MSNSIIVEAVLGNTLIKKISYIIRKSDEQGFN